MSDNFRKHLDLLGEMHELMASDLTNRALCNSCAHKLEESIKAGYLIRTDGDMNDCPYGSDIMYYSDCGNESRLGLIPTKEECTGSGNDRKYYLGETVIFRTIDNGMGYDIVKCPYYERILEGNRYGKHMDEMLKYVDELISRGVSPDVAADNAGYVLYAAMGGQARQSRGTKVIVPEKRFDNAGD